MAGLKVGVGTKKSEKITRKSQQAGNHLPPPWRWAASRGCRAAAAATAAEAGRWVAESACPSHDAKTERFVAWGHFSRSIPITFSSTSSSAFYSDGLQWTNGLRQKLLTIAQCNQKFTTITFFPVFILRVLLWFLISMYDFIFLFQVSRNSLKSLQSEVFTAEIQLSSLFPWSSWP